MILALLLSAVTLQAQAKQGSPLISSFVRSDGSRIKRQPHEVEELWGNVHYRRGNHTVRADWATYDHETRILKARGKIVAEERPENGEVLTAFGEEGTHNMGTETGTLLPRAGELLRFTRTVPGRPGLDEGWALRSRWDDKAQWVRFEGQCKVEGPDGRSEADWTQYDLERHLVLLKGNAHIQRPDGQSWSEEARYYRDLGLLVLDGRRPVVTTREEKYEAAVQARHIEATREPKSIHGEGEAQGWVVFRDRKGTIEKKKKKKV